MDREAEPAPVLNEARKTTWLEVLVVIVSIVVFFALLLAEQPHAPSIHREESRRNLKLIGLALHNYHDTHGMFPPAGIVREDGTQILSWQARLLPEIESGPAIIAQLDQNSAWDSPQNKVPCSIAIPQYMNPGIPSKTKGAISHYAGNSQVFKINKSLRIGDIADGLSNTLFVGEVSEGLKPWADPTNARDPALGLGKTADQFGGPFRGGTHFLMGDGSVRFISENIDKETLKALATPAGGEPLGEF